ncbi:MAG TPA: protease modulator HflC [Burkholderiales bacterium]|nr:protease modulator HflC [Burkholderiales bacterium]
MKLSTGTILVATAIVLIVASLSVFVVDQRQNAMVFRLGEVVKVEKNPGLYFKIPLLDNVRYFDVRILTIDTAEPEHFLTSEKKNVLVDLFVKWRIEDVRQYYGSIIVGGGGELQAQTRLLQTINDGLRAEFGNRTVHDVVSGERDKIMELMRQKANEDAVKIGVHVLDVRLKRVDLPKEVSQSVYNRMQAERKQAATQLRSTGAAESEKIRADADRQRDVILAQAYREAQRIKGEGDAKSAAVYAGAYDSNREFYTFYRSLEAYKQSFSGKNDVLVLEPNSEFFRYFKSSGKSGK